jgi:hypothetical protein
MTSSFHDALPLLFREDYLPLFYRQINWVPIFFLNASTRDQTV